MAVSPRVLPDRTGIFIIAHNNNTIELLHAALISFLNFDHDFGTNSALQAISSDNTCVLGLVMVASILILGGCSPDDSHVKSILQRAKERLENVTPSVGIRERQLVQAASLYMNGYRYQAMDLWENLIYESDCLNDLLAAKLLSSAAFFTGESRHGRIARTTETMLLAWDKNSYLRTSEYYSHLLSLNTFGLGEFMHYAKAERSALKALALYPSDVFALCTFCHVMLEQGGRTQEALHLLSTTEEKWNVHGGLVCHINWYWALFYIEVGMYDNALELFDRKIITAVQNSEGSMLDVTDAVSLLWRLELLHRSVGSHRWDAIYVVLAPLITPISSLLHVYSICATHIMVLLCRADSNAAAEFLRFLTDDNIDHSKLIPSDELYLKHQSRRVGFLLCEALYNYFTEENFQGALSNFLLLRNYMGCCGGSLPQHDVFHQTLISCAIRLGRLKLASSLMVDRFSSKQSNVTDFFKECINNHQR
uniref:Tetratricopeptide repeat protein 38 n=1 Tax=Corethron hystrix TaxID=216773 RepID=A0A7S1FUN9_9STRA